MVKYHAINELEHWYLQYEENKIVIENYFSNSLSHLPSY